MLQDEQQRPQVKSRLGFGEPEGFANKAYQALAQDVVPPFLMSRFAGLFANGAMLLLRQDRLVSAPGITACRAGSVIG